MHPELTEKLCCATCRGRLRLEIDVWLRATGHVDQGRLCCESCACYYPISQGIARFLESEAYVASFGRQWTRYAVQRYEEDLEVFQAKTGFQLDDLPGQTVLDAGCGGGRYTLVAARHGAHVLAIDMSRSVDQAARLCAKEPNVDCLQADLLDLPLAERSVDLAFSIGVLHHSKDPAAAFRQIAQTVRHGGRLALWLYRRNTWFQEILNQTLRGITTRMGPDQLEALASCAALLGSIPLANRTLNKVVNFSNHPVWENRVCDTFDWYSPRYQSHHTVVEVTDWLRNAGFGMVRELPAEKSGRLYGWALRRGLIIGSGVNLVGRKLPPTRVECDEEGWKDGRVEGWKGGRS